MSWFKIVKTTGREAGRGHFNDQNQWSSSMIKCKSKSISFSRISLQSVCLSVCGLQVIKKVIKGNERRPVETARGRESLIILSIFYMNFHNAIMRPVWQKSILSRVRLSNGSERRWITKKEKENTVARRPKLCTMAQKFPHLHVQKKKTADHSRLLYTRGFERDGESSTEREDESSLSLCSHEEPALAKCSGGGQ